MNDDVREYVMRSSGWFEKEKGRCAAGRTPGRPKIQNDDLAFEIGRMNGFAVQILKLPTRRGLWCFQFVWRHLRWNGCHSTPHGE